MTVTGLREKVVIVTGAAAGIGRATARRFAGEQCRVAAWDLNDSRRDDLEHELESEGGQPLFRKTNVTDSKDVEVAVREVIDR